MLPYIEEYLSLHHSDPVAIRDRDKFLRQLQDSELNHEITESERYRIISNLGKITEEAQVYRAFSWFADRNRKGWNTLSLTLIDVDALISTRKHCIEFANWRTSASYDYRTATTDMLLLTMMKRYVAAVGTGDPAWGEFSNLKYCILMGIKNACFGKKMKNTAKQIFIPKEREYLSILQDTGETTERSSAFSKGNGNSDSEYLLDYQMELLEHFFDYSLTGLADKFRDVITRIETNPSLTNKQSVITRIQSYYLNLQDSHVSESTVLSNFIEVKRTDNLDWMLLYPERSWDTTFEHCRWFASIFTKEFFLKEMIQSKLRVDTTYMTSDQRRPLRDDYFPTLDLMSNYGLINREEYLYYKQEGAKFL